MLRQADNSQKGYRPLVGREVKDAAPEGHKWCSHHLSYCPIADFGSDPRHYDGLLSSCRRAEHEREFRRLGRSPSKATKYSPAPNGTKWCWWHRNFETLSDFDDQRVTAKDRSGKRGFCRQGQAEYIRKNAHRYLAHVHTRRARKKASGGTHTAADIAAIAKAQGHRCAYCRADLRKTKRHVDHIMPLALGGSNDKSNIQLTCQPCNLSKGARDPIAFAQERGMLL